MKDDIDKLIIILNKYKNKTSKQEQKDTEYLINILNNINSITSTELDKIENILFDLDMKYEFYYDINYYYVPILNNIKNSIKREEIKRLRNKNRLKREKKI